MKTLGLIGGMSWESTATYYRLINQEVKEQVGGLHSAKILMHSVDFAEIEVMQTEQRWEDAGGLLGNAAFGLERAGADYLMICSNTMHKVAAQVEERISVPLLHIADATAERIVRDGITSIGLLGTSFTMEQEFYRGRLEQKYGLGVLVPDVDERVRVHDIIFRELCLGMVHEGSRQEYLRVIENLADKGAEAVILGCTEISLLLRPEDTQLSLYDTTLLHAVRGVRAMLSE